MLTFKHILCKYVKIDIHYVLMVILLSRSYWLLCCPQMQYYFDVHIVLTLIQIRVSMYIVQTFTRKHLVRTENKNATHTHTYIHTHAHTQCMSFLPDESMGICSIEGCGNFNKTKMSNQYDVPLNSVCIVSEHYVHDMQCEMFIQGFYHMYNNYTQRKCRHVLYTLHLNTLFKREFNFRQMQTAILFYLMPVQKGICIIRNIWFYFIERYM